MDFSGVVRKSKKVCNQSVIVIISLWSKHVHALSHVEYILSDGRVQSSPFISASDTTLTSLLHL